MGDESAEDFNEKIVQIGGSALLGTSVLTGVIVSLGKSQVAQRAAKKGEDNIDFKKMNEGTSNHPILWYFRFIYHLCYSDIFM